MKRLAMALALLSASGCAPAQTPAPSAAGEASDAYQARVEYVGPVAPVTPGPELIFQDRFDSPEGLRSRYFDYGDEGGSFLWTGAEGYGGGGGAMECRFRKGQVSAGSLKVLFGRNPFGRGVRGGETFREVYWRVYVKHQAGWRGNPAKLARLTCLAGTNWSQGFIAHVWGGKGLVLCIDPATGITEGRKVSERYNDFDHLRWLGLRNASTPIFAAEESGRWVCVESRVRLNTPGRKDGVFSLWVDGKLEAHREDLDWHGAWDEYAINALFLENYWNEGSPVEQRRWFDELVVATRPTGPVTLAGDLGIKRVDGPASEWEAQVAEDPEGNSVVWASHTLRGAVTLTPISSTSGGFHGGRSEAGSLAPGTLHWVRVRARGQGGRWSPWSSWHSPFRTASRPPARKDDTP